MNRSATLSVVLVVLFSISLGACSTAPPSLDTGPDAEVDHLGLVRVLNAGFDDAWARPDFDVSGYTQVMFLGAGISYRPAPLRATTGQRLGDQNEFAISDENRQQLEETVSEIFREELTQVQGYEVVDVASPEALLLEIGLVDVVSHVPPEPFARSNIYLSEVGEATLVLELKDSESGAVLARASDRRAAESGVGVLTLSNPVTNWAEVRQLAQRWARLMRVRLEEMSEITLD